MNEDDLKPFTTDGCSDCGLSKLFSMFGLLVPEELDKYCREHDKAYWKGGTKEERLAADAKFYWRIRSAGHPNLAWLYFRSVRLGGVPWLPTSFRWGYGRPYRPWKGQPA